MRGLIDRAAKDLAQVPRWALAAAAGWVFAAVLAMLLATKW